MRSNGAYRMLSEAYDDEDWLDRDTFLHPYGETDDEAFDDDSVDSLTSSLRAARAGSRIMRQRSLVRAGPTRFRPSVGTSNAAVRTPSGAGRVQFEKPVATVETLERFKADTAKAIADARKESQTNIERLDKQIKAGAVAIEELSKSVKSTATTSQSQAQQGQLSMLLPLLQGNPTIEKIRLKNPTAGPTPTVADVLDQELSAEVQYKKDNMKMLLPLVLMGGLGGGAPGGGQDMTMLAVALMMMDR